MTQHTLSLTGVLSVVRQIYFGCSSCSLDVKAVEARRKIELWDRMSRGGLRRQRIHLNSLQKFSENFRKNSEPGSCDKDKRRIFGRILSKIRSKSGVSALSPRTVECKHFMDHHCRRLVPQCVSREKILIMLINPETMESTIKQSIQWRQKEPEWIFLRFRVNLCFLEKFDLIISVW